MALFTSFPKIYSRCITVVSRKAVLRSQSGLSIKGVEPVGPGSTPAQVLSKWETFSLPIPVSSPPTACLLVLLCAGLYPVNVQNPANQTAECESNYINILF